MEILKKGLIALIVGGLLISIGIVQFIYIPMNKSRLIWSNYSSSSTGSDTFFLPQTPNNYFFIIEAHHSVWGHDWTGLDITFLRSETSTSYPYEFDVFSASYIGWYDDSAILNIPSGEYFVSWNCSGVLNYKLLLYIEGIFNNGDSNFFNEEMTMFGSGIGLYLTLSFGIPCIIVGLYFLIKSQFSSNKGRSSKSKKGNESTIKEKLEKEEILRKLMLVKAKQVVEQKLAQERLMKIATKCPNCGNIILNQKECVICKYKFE